MQVRPANTKPKYQISNFQAAGNAKINLVQYYSNKDSVKIYCICGNYTQSTQIRCCRCKSSYHLNCIAKKSQEFKDKWQCPQCRNFYMDPIYTVKQKLIQTHYKTQSIFQYTNQIKFHFNLTEQQLQAPVQVRGLKDGKQNLFWPMQGQFYVNEQQHKDPALQLKPLLANSNRKNRKQQCFIIPKNYLKKGMNYLKFYIPKLNLTAFKSKYQYQERQVYFLGIYSINKLTKGQLISKTIKTNALQQKQSLKLLKQLTNMDDPDLQVQKITINLQCPYMKSKIRIPARGRYCRHYHCLCLQTLIQTRVGFSSRQWLCPICSKKINQPIVDLFLLRIVNDGHLQTKITLNFDGSYQWIKQSFDDDDYSSDQNQVQKKQIQVQKPQEKTKEKLKERQIQKHIQKMISEKPSQKKIIQRKIPDKKNIERRMKQKPIEDLLMKSKKVQKSHLIQKKPTPQVQQIAQQQIIDLDDDDQPFIIQQLDIPLKTEDLKKNKQKIVLEKQKIIKAVKQVRNKKRQNNTFQPKKSDFVLKQVKDLEFRNLSSNDFARRYFKIDYNRNKIPEDLQILFRDVL